MDASTGKLTFERLASLPDDDLRHELIDGVHFATESPGLPHQVVCWAICTGRCGRSPRLSRRDVFA